jgi:hypothetical protein
MALAKMRTVKQAYQIIHKEDPESSISEYYLRTLVKTKPNQIGVFKSGSKFLINYDLLMDYLNNQSIEEDDIPFHDYGQIRRVSE